MLLLKDNVYFIMKYQFVLAFMQILFISRLDADPLVQVKQGILSGIIQESRNGRNYSAFLGIPYAEPPTGNLRFQNPVPGKKWEGVRLADKYGNMCPQRFNSDLMGDEDCLYLNIFSPFLEYNYQKTDEEKNKTLLPVMIWIHGGAFYLGSSNQYAANFLLDKDVILVTLNYRLGILGFLSTGDSVSPGNFGLKDQVLAMKWVKENIEVFGGDQNRVTIFGESAGGASVALHALSKASDGLFQQYIIQSGSPLCPWVYKNSTNLKKHVKKLAVLHLCPFHKSEELVKCLRALNVSTLIRPMNILSAITDFGQWTWGPTNEPEVDGAFLTDNPINLIEQNQMKDLPFMTGQTADESKFMTAAFYSGLVTPNLIKVALASFKSYIANYYMTSEDVSSFIDAVDKYYFNDTLNITSKEEFIENFSRFASDSFFLYPEVRMLEKTVSNMKNSVYFYSFGYRGYSSISNLLTGDNRNIGVAHADELLYLFSNVLEHFGMPKIETNKIDESIIDLMVDMWTSFAINGKPTSKKLLNPDLWTPYTIEKPNYLQIGDINNNTVPTVTLSDNYFMNRMNFWKQMISA